MKYAKYTQQIVDRICELISADSYTIKEICKIVGINQDTYYDWMNKKSDFSDAVKKARGQFDDKIASEAEKSLVKKIQGYTVDEVRIVQRKNELGKMVVAEKVTMKKQVNPDTAAIIFALTNKVPDKYNNRQFTGITTNEKDLNTTVQVEIIKNTD